MNEQEQLKLQAHLDGELTAGERREVEDWLAERADARALLDELRHTSTALRDHEPVYRLDCSREFYWQNIGRIVERSGPAVGDGVIEFVGSWLRRHIAQVAGVAACVVVAMLALTLIPAEVQSDSEWEVLHPGTGMVTYRDYDSGMTVVMLYDRSSTGFTPGD